MTTFVVYLPGDVPVKPGSGANEVYRKEHMQAIRCMLPGFARVYSSVALCTDWSKTSAAARVKVVGGSLLFVAIDDASAEPAIRVSAASAVQDWAADRILDMVVLAITSADPLLYTDYETTKARDAILVPVEASAALSNADRSKMSVTDDLVTISKYYTLSDSNEKTAETTNPLTQDEMIRATD